MADSLTTVFSKNEVVEKIYGTQCRRKYNSQVEVSMKKEDDHCCERSTKVAMILPRTPANTGHLSIYSFHPLTSQSVASKFLLIEQEQCIEIDQIQFTDPVVCVYNPLDYAFDTHLDFVNRYCNSEKPVLFLGMNPGPYGMAQNGVPFGEVNTVKEWLKIKGTVHKPSNEHPQRKISGLDCTRKEDDIDLCIRNPKVHDRANSEKYISYEIVIMTNSKTFALCRSSIRRRYSEFSWFRNELKKHHPDIVPPSMPPKMYTSERFKSSSVFHRMKGLEKFLKELIDHRTYLSDTTFHLFLQSDLSCKQITDYEDGKMGLDYLDKLWAIGGKICPESISKHEQDNFF